MMIEKAEIWITCERTLKGDARAERVPLKQGLKQERDPEVLRLSNALSALYPKGSDKKRLLDVMLLAMTK